MDLIRENVENAFNSNARNLKTVGTEHLKKHIAKPLSDVKNILSDKGCASLSRNIKENVKEMCLKAQPAETEVRVDPLYYFEEREDDYRDILPLDLQLTNDDIKNLSYVFDVPHYGKSIELRLDCLPFPEVPHDLFNEEEDQYIVSIRNKIDSCGDLFDVDYPEDFY